jgi:hypothetical protein
MRPNIADGNYGIGVAGPRQWHLLPPQTDPTAGPMTFRVPENFLSGEM